MLPGKRSVSTLYIYANRAFLQLEYSVELLIEYLSTRPIPEVAVNYRVAQNNSGHMFLPYSSL